MKHDLVFGTGSYAPETDHGRRLLAHEVVHTLQQQRSPEASSSGSGYRLLGTPNREVGSSYVQRQSDGTRGSGTPARVPHNRGSRSPTTTSSQHESGQDYIDFLQGIDDLTTAASSDARGWAGTRTRPR